MLAEGVADAAAVLHRNRRLALVRFAVERGRRDLGPRRAAGASARPRDEREVDRLLGLLIDAADELRGALRARRRERESR